jgi:hypothetical protein
MVEMDGVWDGEGFVHIIEDPELVQRVMRGEEITLFTKRAFIVLSVIYPDKIRVREIN